MFVISEEGKPEHAGGGWVDPKRSPLVTVAIPTYRRPNLLRCAIESALAQTYRNIEILVSDSDGSDEIAALVTSYQDARLRYRRNEGRTNGLENALAMYRDARGELIATLHDDDEWEPGFLDAMVKPLVDDPTLALTFADYWVMNAEGDVLHTKSEANSRERGRAGLAAGRHQPFVRLALVDRAVFFVVATIFRNGIVDWDEVPPEVAPPHEIWMAYLASRDGAAAYYVPQRLMRYRVHPEAASQTSRLEQAAVWTYDRILLDERMANLRDDLFRASAPFRASLGLTLLAEGDPRARRYLWQGLRGGARSQAGAGLVISLLPRSLRADTIERLRSGAQRRRSHQHAPQVLT